MKYGWLSPIRGRFLVSVKTLFVCIGLAPQLAEAQKPNVSIAVFDALSDARITESKCATGKFREGRCFADHDRITVAVAALIAIADFNQRNGSTIQQFASNGIRACDKIVSFAGLWDTRSSRLEALRKYFEVSRLDVLIGPTRSDTASTIAPVLGLTSTPIIAASTTAPTLSSENRYPNFMRTVPSDEAVAYATCELLRAELNVTKLAVIHVTDPFGSGYADALRQRCDFGGQRSLQQLNDIAAGELAFTRTSVQVESFGFEQGSNTSITSAIRKFAESLVNVVMVVALGQDNAAVLEEAYQRGVIRSMPQSLWILSDAARTQYLEDLSEKATRAVSGSMRVTATGADESNAVWRKFVERWPSFEAKDFNPHLPDYWQVNNTLFKGFDFNSSAIARETAAFTFDAVAAAALLACAVAPNGSLPMNFGEEFIRTKENIDFVGLSGRVIFDKNGDRLISSAHYMLANVLRRRQEANAWSFELVQKATFRDGSWSWHSGMMDLIFNHDSTDLPTDSLLETPPPPAPPPPNKSSYTAEYVLFFVCIVIASVLVFLLLCLAIAFAFLRLRAISHKFGIRPVALAKLLFRRRLQPRRELRPPKYPLALSKLKVAVANHQHLHTLFRKYCADGQIMRVEEWLQFQRDEQHEFDANQATKPFLAVALALEHQSKASRLRSPWRKQRLLHSRFKSLHHSCNALGQHSSSESRCSGEVIDKASDAGQYSQHITIPRHQGVGDASSEMTIASTLDSSTTSTKDMAINSALRNPAFNTATDTSKVLVSIEESVQATCHTEDAATMPFAASPRGAATRLKNEAKHATDACSVSPEGKAPGGGFKRVTIGHQEATGSGTGEVERMSKNTSAVLPTRVEGCYNSGERSGSSLPRASFFTTEGSTQQSVGSSTKQKGVLRKWLKQIAPLQQLERTQRVSGRRKRAGVSARMSSASSEPLSSVGAPNGLTFEQFSLALVGAQNKIASPVKLASQARLDLPLSHYWISSSHNSYLTGHQLTSESTAHMYRRQLIQGCRCLEIDIWDGPKGEPEVTHGYTLVTREKLRRVAVAIREEAFRTSELPVILSLDVKASTKQQERAADIFRHEFSSHLLTPGEAVASSLGKLPLEQLAFRIILKGKTAEGQNLAVAICRHRVDEIDEMGRDSGGTESTSGGGLKRDLLSILGLRRFNGVASNSASLRHEENESQVLTPKELAAPALQELISAHTLPRAAFCFESEVLTADCGSFGGSSDRAGYTRGLCSSGGGSSYAVRNRDEGTGSGSCSPIDANCYIARSGSSGLSMRLSSPNRCGAQPELRSAVFPLTVTSFSEDKWTEDPSEHAKAATIPRASQVAKFTARTKNNLCFAMNTLRPSATQSNDKSPRVVVHTATKRRTSLIQKIRRRKVKRAILMGSTGGGEGVMRVDSTVGRQLQTVFNQQRQTQQRLVRIFPRGLRTKSDNFSPLSYWASGAQLCALNLQTNDLATQLHHALFELNGGRGYVQKPAEMLSPEPAWPPSRLQLHVVTLRPLTLFQLPARGEERPFLRGLRQRAHAYVGELSYCSPMLKKAAGVGRVYLPTLAVELHAIGGFHAVSPTLPPTSGSTRSLVKATESDGVNSHYEQTVHCVAAEPMECVLRVAVLDDEMGAEVAYETVVVGAVREGYRVLHLRSMLGTRIESCFLLVHISFSSQVNAWVGEHELIKTLDDQRRLLAKYEAKNQALETQLRYYVDACGLHGIAKYDAVCPVCTTLRTAETVLESAAGAAAETASDQTSLCAHCEDGSGYVSLSTLCSTINEGFEGSVRQRACPV